MMEFASMCYIEILYKYEPFFDKASASKSIMG